MIIASVILRASMVWIIMALAMGYLGGVITRGKGLPFAVGFILGFFMPIIGILIALVLPNDQERIREARNIRANVRDQVKESDEPALTVVPCPACRARIAPKAAFCEKCGVNIEEARALQASEWNAGEEEDDDDFNDELY